MVRRGGDGAMEAGCRLTHSLFRLRMPALVAFLALAVVGATPPPRPGLSLLRLEVDTNDRDAARRVRSILLERLPAVCLESGRYRLPARTDPKLFALLQAELKFQARLVDPAEARALGRMAGIGVFMVAAGDLEVRLRGCDLTLTIRLIDVESSDTLRTCTLHGHGSFHLDPARSGAEAANAILDQFALALQSTPDPKECP